MSERSELCESPEEERLTAISLGFGALLSVVGLVVMLDLASSLSSWHITSVTVISSSLILLYLASAVYHLVTTPRLKRLFQILDHALIFVLIAGSYTPWLLVNLRGPWGWSLFFVVRGIALARMVLKACLLPRFDKLGTALYVIMGWLVCIAIKPLIENVGLVGISWLVAGGLCYTGGVAFYLMKRRFAHFTWHLFVLAGSFCHVVAVITGVLQDQ